MEIQPQYKKPTSDQQFSNKNANFDGVGVAKVLGTGVAGTGAVEAGTTPGVEGTGAPENTGVGHAGRPANTGGC